VVDVEDVEAAAVVVGTVVAGTVVAFVEAVEEVEVAAVELLQKFMSSGEGF
jgi:hypothetical protein